jgi:hypothetical protein
MDHDTLSEITSFNCDLGVFSKLFKIPEKSLKDFMAKSMYNNDIIISYNLTPDTAIEFAK